MMVISTNVGFPRGMRLKLYRGDKKRCVLIRRPSLKLINSRIKRGNAVLRMLKAELKRTMALDVDRQVTLNQEITRVRRVNEGILRYVEILTSPRTE